MTAKWKRPLDVDFTCDLRIIGNGKESIHISSDEGDEYSFTKGEGEEPTKEHYAEWAEQLENIVEWLRNKSE